MADAMADAAPGGGESSTPPPTPPPARAAGAAAEAAAEIARMEAVVARDPGWIRFSLSTARWVPFSVDPDIQRAFADPGRTGSREDMEQWLKNAELSVMFWIIRRITEREHRSSLFRALGRGWIFIYLMQSQMKFKWWFEGVARVLKDHQQDIKGLKLDAAGVEKYTTGYMCNSEVVFMTKGLVPRSYVPAISIMKMAQNWVHREKWAPSEDLQRAVQTPTPSDADRRAHAARARRRHACRQRQRERRATGAGGDAAAPLPGSTPPAEDDDPPASGDEEDGDGSPAPAKAPERMQQSNRDFERLLAEIKGELARHAAPGGGEGEEVEE